MTTVPISREPSEPATDRSQTLYGDAHALHVGRAQPARVEQYGQLSENLNTAYRSLAASLTGSLAADVFALERGAILDEIIANFIERNPTIVMLALGFLLMIGMVLIADGFGVHVPKGYIYAAMGFSALVEGLNMMARRARAKGR